jgi:hypothetical protein
MAFATTVALPDTVAADASKAMLTNCLCSSA